MTPIHIAYPNIFVILPELILMCWVFFMMMADLFISKEKKEVNALLAIIGILLSAAAVFVVMPSGHITSFNDSMVSDSFALFFKLLFCIAAVLTILISRKYIAIEGMNWGEYYTLLLFAVSGMMVPCICNRPGHDIPWDGVYGPDRVCINRIFKA